MTGRAMDGDGCGEKQLWTTLKRCRNILLLWLGKITRNLSGDSWLPKSNPTFPNMTNVTTFVRSVVLSSHARKQW